jgi:hypothetical protein
MARAVGDQAGAGRGVEIGKTQDITAGFTDCRCFEFCTWMRASGGWG